MDVTAAVTEITGAGTAAGTVGAAVLGVLGIIMAYRIVRRAFG